MASESLKEYRQMAADQLKEKEQELRRESFDLRTAGTEKGKDTSKARKVKKEIARILTVQREAELKKNAKA
jgi:ribosomal protein L29